MHLNQVHKEQLNHVDNALPNRQGLDIEIFGMEGIPEDIKQQHDQRMTTKYYEDQAERRETTGNPIAGSKDAYQIRPPKFEDIEELKARFRDHIKKVESGDMSSVTPMNDVQPTPVPVLVGKAYNCMLIHADDINSRSLPRQIKLHHFLAPRASHSRQWASVLQVDLRS